MTDQLWTEDFLNRLRTESDPPADETLRLIIVSTFPVLADFFQRTGNFPANVVSEVKSINDPATAGA